MLAVIAIIAAVAGGSLGVTMNTTRPRVGQRAIVSMTGQVADKGHLYVYRNLTRRCSDTVAGERRTGRRMANWPVSRPFDHTVSFTPRRVMTQWVCVYLYSITCDAAGNNCAPAIGLPPDAGFSQVRIRVRPRSH